MGVPLAVSRAPPRPIGRLRHITQCERGQFGAITRALQEKVAARNATSEVARERHEQLAAMYRFRTAMISSGPAQWNEELREECAEESA